MYMAVLNKQAIDKMQRQAAKLRQEYLDYAEDLKLYTNPEFWKAIQEAESGKAVKAKPRDLPRLLGR